jgi:hypothetical protein
MMKILNAPLTEIEAGDLRDIEWILASRDRMEYTRKFLEVMAEMDRHYQDDLQGQAYENMVAEGCHYFYGRGDGFEVVVGFQWNDAREKYQLRTAGFRGDITPHEALLQMIQLSRSFAHSAGVKAIYTIVPRTMDNPRILQFYGLIPYCPSLKVTGGHFVEGGTYWRLELAEPSRSTS